MNGVESDDGFIIGRFTLGGTFSLLIATMVMGSIVGLIVVAGRPFLPRRGTVAAWGVAGAVAGGGLLIHYDGIDFTALEPHWLAVALFIAIPGLGAWLIAWLVEMLHGWWWKRRLPTLTTAITALPALIFFVSVAAAVVGAAWLVVLQSTRLRRMHNWRPLRIAAVATFALVIALGGAELTKDLRQVL